MANERLDDPRGILNPETFAQYVTLNRYLPGRTLAPYVEHYWQVHWELPSGTSYTSETLPHPSVHMVFEPEAAYLQGVTTERFSYTSRGKETVFSVKFLPGMFFPFVDKPLSHFTDRRIPLDELYGGAGTEVAAAVFGAPDEDGRIRAIEDFLQGVLDGWLSRTGGNAARIGEACRKMREIVRYIEETRECTSVALLADALPAVPGLVSDPPLHVLGVRSLQALFKRYVGVGPKWIIRRYRLHEAIAVLDSGQMMDLASLAIELGYSDQAHFTNDFRAMTGRTPGRYGDNAEEKSVKRRGE